MSPQSQWTPPVADKQAWTPPAADRAVANTSASHGDRLKGTPTNLPDNFMGTLAKDFAAIPEGAWNAVTHPIDTVKGAVHQLVNLPGDVMTDISQGNWGKLAAKFTELAVPALNTERGAAMAADAGNAAKGAAAAVGNKAVEIAANPVARELIGVASPRLKNALTAINRVKTAAQQSAAEDATAAAPAAAANTALMDQMAQAYGVKDFASLPPEGQATVRQLADRISGTQPVATAPPPRRPMGPPQAPPAEAAAPVENISLAEMIRRETMGAKPPVEEAAQPLQGGNPVTPIQQRGTPLRPPTRTVEPQAAPVAAEPVATPQRTLPQVEAAMEQKQPAPIENTQTRTNADGSSMSSQMRGAVKKAGNVQQKAARFADAFEAEGVTAEDVRNMTGAERQQMTDGLIAKGRLEPGETAPNNSVPNIISELKKREKAAAPKAESKAAVSPDKWRAPGGGMGAMKNYFTENK